MNVIVTFAPGGTLDTATRILATKAEKFLGQPVMVSNVGGGGGSVALAQVASFTFSIGNDAGFESRFREIGVAIIVIALLEVISRISLRAGRVSGAEVRVRIAGANS